MSDLTDKLGNNPPKEEKVFELWDAVLIGIVIIFIAFVVIKTIKINNTRMAEFDKTQQEKINKEATFNNGLKNLLKEAPPRTL